MVKLQTMQYWWQLVELGGNVGDCVMPGALCSLTGL